MSVLGMRHDKDKGAHIEHCNTFNRWKTRPSVQPFWLITRDCNCGGKLIQHKLQQKQARQLLKQYEVKFQVACFKKSEVRAAILKKDPALLIISEPKFSASP